MTDSQPPQRDAFGNAVPSQGAGFGGFAPPQAPPSVGPPGAAPVAAPQPAVGPAGNEPPPGVESPRWHPWMALAVPVAGLVGASIMFAVVVAAYGAGSDQRLDPDNLPPSVSIASLIVQDLAFLLAAIGIAATLSRPHPWHFGLRPVRRLWPAVGWAALVYPAFALFTYLWLTVIGKTGERDTIAQDLGADSSTATAIVVVVLVAVVAPIVEELMFRGVIFGSLRSRLDLWPAALITGVMFGGAHVLGSPLAFIVPLAFLGTALCLLYHRTGSLYPSMAVHAVNNSVAIVAAIDWPAWLIPVVIAGSLLSLALLAALVRRLSAPVPAGAPCP